MGRAPRSFAFRNYFLTEKQGGGAWRSLGFSVLLFQLVLIITTSKAKKLLQVVGIGVRCPCVAFRYGPAGMRQAFAFDMGVNSPDRVTLPLFYLLRYKR